MENLVWGTEERDRQCSCWTLEVEARGLRIGMSPSQKQERGEKEESNGEEKRETRKGGPLGTREALLTATVSGMAGWRRRPLSWALDSETWQYRESFMGGTVQVEEMMNVQSWGSPGKAWFREYNKLVSLVTKITLLKMTVDLFQGYVGKEKECQSCRLRLWRILSSVWDLRGCIRPQAA